MLLACNYIDGDGFTPNSTFDTSSNTHGEELYSLLALRTYSEEFVDLLVEQYEQEEQLFEWLELARAIILRDVEYVQAFLFKYCTNTEKFNSIKKFIISLDNHSLDSASVACSSHLVCIKPYILETLIENIRQKDFVQNPSRFDSYICFGSKNDADSFQSLLEADECFEKTEGAILAQLNTDLCDVQFVADQSYINNIHEDMTIEQTIGMINNYWEQNKSDAPITEILLQGEVGVVSLL